MIVLYDISSGLPEKSWSPNTLKIRFSLHLIALNFKGMPYRTEWIEYPDIEALCKKIGALPTSKKADGRDHYTMPVIYDESTKKAISDSKRIALYLDETYPNAHVLFPKAVVSGATLSTEGAIKLFEDLFMEHAAANMRPVVLPLVANILNPASEAYFRNSFEANYGFKIEDFSRSESKKYIQDWRKVKEGLDKVDAALTRNDGNRREKSIYFLGDVFSYADAVMVGFLIYMKQLIELREWEVVAEWNEGRWAELLEASKEYQVVV